MKFQLSCLAVVCTLSLAACSNSGSSTGKTAAPSENNTVNTITAQTNNTQNNTTTDSPNTPSTPNTPPTTTAPSAPSTPSTPPSTTTPSAPSTPSTPPSTTTPSTPPIVGNNVRGHVQSPVDPLSRSRQDVTVYPVDSTYGSNKIKIDGREIDLALPVTYSDNGFDYIHTPSNSSNGTSTIMISKGFKHVRFGTFMDFRDPNVHKYGVFASHFVFGDVTADGDVPRSGMASYSGRAILRPIGAGDPKEWQGDAKFDVDFGKKSIVGSVFYEPVAKNPAVTDPIVKIPLAGSIDGASFSGTHNGNIMHGHFYGPQAAELGGTFITERMRGHYLSGEKYITGAFGAAKQ